MTTDRTCKVRKGFFVLRDCKQSATAKCTACHRYTCSDHIYRAAGAVGTSGSGLRCTECAAKFETDLDAGDRRGFAWRNHYRRSYYDRYGYRPYYYGSSRYDDYDTRSFRHHNGRDDFRDDDGDVDFYDS